MLYTLEPGASIRKDQRFCIRLFK